MIEVIEGRIVKAVGGLYTVATERQGRYDCKVRGIFRKHKFTPLVGDYAAVEMIDEQRRTGTITRFRERKTELIRPRVANVDQVIIIFATENPQPNPDMTDRLVLLAEERGIEIIICVNKIDLTKELADFVEIYESAGYSVFRASAKTGEGIDKLRAALADKVSAFAGPSGVGKSSIVNALLADEKMQTGELSRKLGRGKHTTRHAELIEISPGTFVVDTPGFSSLELNTITRETLPLLFREFRPYLDECRFTDCNHINEPDCAVKDQVGINIHPERYERYKVIYQESG